MNWTGGTRARHNRPSSDTNRLQKRYFAKVRAAQSSIHSVAHAGPFGILGAEDSANRPGKRKKPPIPAFDIIIPKDGDASQGVAAKKRKLLETTHELGVSTPTPSVQSFGNMGQGSGRLRSKKQLLLEKDDWVCTTLARPLVLKNQGDHPSGRRHATAVKVAKPLGLDLCEPFPVQTHSHGARSAENNPRAYTPLVYTPLVPPSPERRTHVDAGEDSDRRFGRAFQNLSDGGFVQIGGSTQAGNRTATPHSFVEHGSIEREMSHISEETMLFDLYGRQETPSRPSPPTRRMAGRATGGIFGGDYQTPFVQDGSEDMVYYPRDSRVSWGGDVDRFPSSPLAPYSQNVRSQGVLIPRNNPPADNQEPADSLIGEIEKVVADLDPRISPEIQSAICLGPEPVTPPPTRVQLPPAGKDIPRNLGYQGRQHSRYQTHDHYQVLESNRRNLFGLNGLLEGEIKSTPNLSLMAYASSSETSPTNDDDDDGENWMLGSNVSPGLYGTREANANVHPPESGDWEAFLNNSALAGGMDVGQEDLKDDAQSYLDQLGIWEKQSGDIGGQELVENQYSDNEEECRDFYHQGEDVVPVAKITSTTEFPYSRDLPAATTGLCILSEEDKVASPEGFLEEPLEESCEIEDNVPVDSFGANDEATVGTSGMTPQTIMSEFDRNPKKESAASQGINNETALHLDLDGDEDRAWRTFVFAGLDDNPDQEESITAPRPPKQNFRRSSLKPISQFSRIESPELQLPSPPQQFDSRQPPDLQSTVGATVWSGSLPNSGDGTSVAGTPTVRRRSKFFDGSLSSSSAPSPVSSCTRLENVNRQKGEKRLITAWLGKGSTKKKDINKEDNGEKEIGGKNQGAGVDVIEEW